MSLEPRWHGFVPPDDLTWWSEPVKTQSNANRCTTMWSSSAQPDDWIVNKGWNALSSGRIARTVIPPTTIYMVYSEGNLHWGSNTELSLLLRARIRSNGVMQLYTIDQQDFGFVTIGTNVIWRMEGSIELPNVDFIEPFWCIDNDPPVFFSQPIDSFLWRNLVVDPE